MSIWKVTVVPEMRRMKVLCLFLGLGLCMIPVSAGACSCGGRGPFLSVAKDAPLVVRARILHHHGAEAPAIDVVVLGTLHGGLLDSVLVIQMGD
jgi:hypothetical protein